MDITILNNHFKLLWQRAIYWREQKALIISDSHFGKAAHFRKGGIAVPGALFNTDLQILDALVDAYEPQQLIVIGDMFHSRYNNEVAKFGTWRKEHDELTIKLAIGNHDILGKNVYAEMAIEAVPLIAIENIHFSHEPYATEKGFCFSGHLHPGMRIDGHGRQSMRLPCFHFSGSCCTLPAFSLFTGLANIDVVKGDKVFVIVEKEVLSWQ